MKDNFFYLAIGVVAISVLLGVAFAYFSQPSQPFTTYDATDEQKPNIELSQTKFDLGELNSTSVRSVSSTIKNNGQKNLEIKNIKTSCGCISAKFSVNGQGSPKFSMHNTDASWKGVIEPGQTGEIITTYDVSIMPVTGAIERVVYFQTNDPLQPNQEITLKAIVI